MAVEVVVFDSNGNEVGRYPMPPGGQEVSVEPGYSVVPIVDGAAIKGPAAKIMAELGHEVSCVGVARTYQGICDVFVIDEQDAHLVAEIERTGLKTMVASTIMNTEADKIGLARRILQLKGD